MLTVVATIKAKPGKESETEQALLALLEPTRSEAGCLQYDMHRDNDDPSLFIFYENWESRDHLDQHIATPHLKEFFEKEAELLARPVEIRCLTRK